MNSEPVPTVSAVIPTYNRDDHLKRAVKSVLEQSYDDIEVVVVDDCSPLPAEEVLTASGMDLSSVTVHRHEENKGANGARNTGVELASGEFIAFLDDDDEWLETKIEKQVRLASERGAGIVYTGVEQVSDGMTVATKTPAISGKITKDLLCRNVIGTFSSILVDREVFEDAGRLEEKLPSWQDWDFYLRASEETTFESVPEPLVRQHSHDGERISGNYESKRDVTVPKFMEKYRPRAERYGVRNEFEATLAAELGWSAVANDEFNEARGHFVRSIKHKISKKTILMLVSVLGGKWTYRLAQKIKYSLPGAIKFKDI